MSLIINKNIYFIVLLVITLTLNACTLLDVKKQSEFADSLAIISGKITVEGIPDISDYNIVVVLMKQTDNFLFKRVSYVLADKYGNYKFHRESGTYIVGAFLDTNNDKRYQSTEYGEIYGKPDSIKTSQKQITQIDIRISGKINKRIAYDANSFDQTHLSLKNIGKVVTLEDERFNEENGPLGLWRPIDYLTKYGAGLFLLQKYNSNKIPIIFVHGANGGADDWKSVISNLDSNQFQAWVLNYPSGMRLEAVSDYFVRALNELQRKYKMNKIYIVAHSMGGLVTRSFVMKYQTKYPKLFENLKFTMTINSPMMGMASASSGVKYSPIVVPSWRDIAPESDFLKKINTWFWPVKLPYHLAFSYLSGEGGDGVVDLDSQIPAKLQSEATKIHGFNASHAGILKDEKFLKRFKRILTSIEEE